uniref:Homeobox domain-containing protein n=1 Tax=Rhabditophanes sp. KR3021 TaxID=114890 RepID=A0AC35U3S5_9BILA
MAEMKRQQRRQQIIASAFAHTMHEYPHLHGAPSINYIAQLSQLDPVIFANSQTYEYNPTELPTYAEALQLPSPLSAERINSIQANDSAPNDSLSETSNGLTNQLNISTDLSNVKNATSDARNQTVSSNTRFRERATSQGASSSTTPPPYTAVEE